MTIQEFKEHIGQQAESIISQGMNLEKVGTKYRCPNKYSHNNGDQHPSLSWDKKALQFYCFTCTEKIDIYSYYTNYKNMSHEEVIGMYETDQDNYKIEIKEKPEFKLEPLKDFQMEYLNKRGLSEDTINNFKLGDQKNNIGIPYISNGSITGIKLKNMKGEKPKYLSITGSDFGLFNKDNLDFNEPLVIVEGEIDCMSTFSAGYKNVCSVGTGGSSLDKLIRNEGEFLKKFKALIVFSDSDEVGNGMKKKLLEEFGYRVKFPDIALYMGLKDANEILLKHGKEQIIKIIKSASVKVEGLININSDEIELDLSEMKGSYIATGIASVDLAINDLGPSQVSLITGRSNCGKSTVVTQIIVNAIDKGNRVFLIAGEGITSLLVNNIYKNCIGSNSRYYDIKQVNKRSFKIPKPFVISALKKWHEDRLSIFSKGESRLRTTDELLIMMSEYIKLNKPSLVVIDNLMAVISVDNQNEKWNNQQDFMKSLSDIAKTENTHIMLVLHPSKASRNNATIQMEDISGASELYNLADVILAVKRIYNDEEDHDGEISVIKNRYYPDLVTAQTTFDHETNMLLELGPRGETYKYDLSWEKFLDADDLLSNPLPAFQVNYDEAFNPKTYKKPKKKAEKIKPEQIELVQVN